METFEMRWAPATLADVVYADDALRDYIDTYARGEVSNHLLLYGEPGVGKSAIAGLLPAAFEASATGNAPHVVRFDPETPDNRIVLAIDNLCGQVNITAQAAHFIWFDEVDNFSKNVLKKLRGVLNGNHPVRLLMTTNHVADINGSIRDRSTEWCLLCPTPEQFLPRARHILSVELSGQVMPSDDLVLAVLAKGYDGGRGSVRKMLRRLEMLVLYTQGKSKLNPLTMP